MISAVTNGPSSPVSHGGFRNSQGSVVTVHRTSDSLVDLEADWNQLYARSTPRNPFLSYAWSSACWDTHRAGATPYIVTLRKGGELIGLAPLCLEQRASFRVLRFIGEGRSDYLGFLCAGDGSAEQELLDGLLVNHAHWDLARFSQVGGPFSSLGSVELVPGLLAHRVPATIAPYTAADVEWDQLHEIGPSWLKRTRKRLPRFLRDGWTMERFTGADAASRAEVVAQIEARSWKGRQKLTRLQPGPGQELLRRTLKSLGERGEMELWLASLGGQAVAYQTGFTLPGRLWIFQQAYDEEFQRASVGSFMAYVSIERAWRNGAREYDYMNGDEAYKSERTMATRPVQHVAIHRRTLRGYLAFAVVLAPRWRLKQIPAVRAAYDLAMRLKRRAAG
jgi:CelD/BcsL family acetyltransferase involved in cellulose biosynthesis